MQALRNKIAPWSSSRRQGLPNSLDLRRLCLRCLQLFWCFDIIQTCALGTAKLSVIFFYRSIFRGRAFNIASWSMVCIVLSWLLGYLCAIAFQCGSRFPYIWSSIASHCTKGAAVGLGFSIPDVLTDGLILAMPLYWVSDSRSAVSQTDLLTSSRLGNCKCLFGRNSVCVESFSLVQCEQSVD